jgi:bacillithiol biosynthesis cysteine-adding enzyme BshC
MKLVKETLDLAQTGFFTQLVMDYCSRKKSLEPYIQAFPSAESMLSQIELKQNQPVNRTILVDVLLQQYAHLEVSDLVKQNIEALRNPSTFTICTAHQPNIFTGHLYFIYKIIHAIKLSIECAKLYPKYTFVPVYYIGSEDNDLEEIGELNYYGNSYQWQSGQKGACGRMLTQNFDPILNDVLATLNDQLPDEKHLIELLKHAYNGAHTLSDATRIIVNDLFGKYGIVVLNPDQTDLKKQFSAVMCDELLSKSSHDIVQQTLDGLSQNYKSQAPPRALNLFYLKDDIRERIEFDGNIWTVVNTKIQFSKSELLVELEQFPDHFSPNVILRPLYQETILPNIAFVGGGGELAYWLQLKALFDFHKITYPLLFLRNSVLWINEKSALRKSQIGLSLEDIFFSTEKLVQLQLADHHILEQLKTFESDIELKYAELNLLATQVSDSLKQSVEAHNAKVKNIQQRIHQKFVAHLKRKESDVITKIYSLKQQLFPNNTLQERYHTFLTIYKEFGPTIIADLMLHQDAFSHQFLVLTQCED